VKTVTGGWGTWFAVTYPGLFLQVSRVREWLGRTWRGGEL
jgi:hypothetical protein